MGSCSVSLLFQNVSLSTIYYLRQFFRLETLEWEKEDNNLSKFKLRKDFEKSQCQLSYDFRASSRACESRKSVFYDSLFLWDLSSKVVVKPSSRSWNVDCWQKCSNYFEKLHITQTNQILLSSCFIVYGSDSLRLRLAEVVKYFYNFNFPRNIRPRYEWNESSPNIALSCITGNWCSTFSVPFFVVFKYWVLVEFSCTRENIILEKL